MRILIADDEELTRKGLISSIDWESLGIDRIDDADDGLHALSCIKKCPPDILLTDVRMPRMDGIELSRRLRECSNECPIIFMSGYSDKEYLKAAIHLKAVSYVEKPFTPEDITQALREAVSLVQKQQLQIKSNLLFAEEESSKLALLLTQPAAKLPEDAMLPLASCHYFTTLILRTDELLTALTDEARSELFSDIKKQLLTHHISELHTTKHTSYVIFHFCTEKKPSMQTLHLACRCVRDLLLKMGLTHFHLVLGDCIKGAEHIYRSYNSAVFLLQSAFFTDYETILSPDEPADKPSATYLNEFPAHLQDALANRNQSKTNALTDELFSRLQNNRGLMANQAKDLYYKLLMLVTQLEYDAKISSHSEPIAKSTLGTLNDCQTYRELHTLLTDAITDYFSLLQTSANETSTLFLIKDYISKNYSDSSLSIKDISDHVHLSSSYLCTIFKTETGQTLNQYLTSYRMERAKQLLSDPRNKINEIASRVGYSDQNYFGKTFKKSVGLSPSEYREKESL